MSDGKVNVTCPGCQGELTVDAATGEVLFHKPVKEPLAGGKDFDSLLAGLGDEKAKAEARFEREVAAMKDRDRLMDEKFREALKRAEEDPDTGPPKRPWDLD